MVLTERAVLHFFIFLLSTINGLHSSPHSQQNSLRILSEIIGSARNPMIVYIGSAKPAWDLDDDMVPAHHQSSLESSQSEFPDRNHYHAKLESTYDIFKALLRDDSDDMLRAGKTIAENSEEQLEQEMMIARALRSRCQAIVECEEKCPKEEPKNECSESTEKCSDETTEKCSDESDPCSVEKKPEKYCPKSCKAVFDHLINCPPPGNEKNNHKQKNQSTKACGPPTGRTMPPNWKHH